MNPFGKILSRFGKRGSPGEPATKIFCIGLQKTGTTSFQKAMEHYGYRHKGNSPREYAEWESGNRKPLKALLSSFQSFDDVPYFLIYQWLFERFGADARFVLTLRKSPETWVQSVKQHALRGRPETTNFGKIYGRSFPHGYEHEFISYYENHRKSAIRFFEEKNSSHQLLTVCWETGDGWKELSEFLDLPEPGIPFFHARQGSKERTDETRLLLNTASANQQMLEAILSKLNNK